MKYMGSKRTMLDNGLGEILQNEVPMHARFVDLMCGAGSVSHFVGERFCIPVLGIDLQQYAVDLTNVVINKTAPIDYISVFAPLVSQIQNQIDEDELLVKWRYHSQHIDNEFYVTKAREFCVEHVRETPVFNAYGGHYFSPDQAIIFDILLDRLPKKEPFRTTYIASVLSVAMKCAASPGHTAQPFQPTPTSIKYIFESWRKSPLELFKTELKELSTRYAKVNGIAKVSDAIEEVNDFTKDDVIFIDPPYSSVQYSRFYHVLETIARRTKYNVSGKGRYPEIQNRPQSTFSNVGQSKSAIFELFKRLFEKKCKLIITFPEEKSSNGLSGTYIEEIGSQFYNIQKYVIPARMSTLGGNNNVRKSRVSRDEMVFVMNLK